MVARFLRLSWRRVRRSVALVEEGLENRLALVEELRTRGGVFRRWKIPCITQHDWDIRYSYATKSQGLCISGLDTGPLHPLRVVGVIESGMDTYLETIIMTCSHYYHCMLLARNHIVPTKCTL